MQAIDPEAQRSLRSVEHADILVGIPSYNSERTIGHVIAQSAKGLLEYFSNKKCLILISDGGSVDATVQIAKNVHMPTGVKLVTCRYQGVPGKGSAARAMFEAAIYLGVRSLAMVDSDLRSITPSWIKLLVDPTLNQVGLVTPRYNRHKYDGTITNQLCYPLTRALYGKRIRQPIGGDFGLSAGLVKRLTESSLWKTPYVPKFGIDIFITSSAIAGGFPVEEADLGVKIHDVKDPAFQLGSMFMEVAGSLLSCMEMYEGSWRKIKGSTSVPLRRNKVERIEPQPVSVNLDRLVEEFRTAYSRLNGFRSVLSTEVRRELDFHASSIRDTPTIPPDLWAKTVYEVSARFKGSDETRRKLLLEGLRAVWSGRVATFVKETASMTSEEAERKVEEDAMQFEQMKDELLRIY